MDDWNSFIQGGGWKRKRVSFRIIGIYTHVSLITAQPRSTTLATPNIMHSVCSSCIIIESLTIFFLLSCFFFVSSSIILIGKIGNVVMKFSKKFLLFSKAIALIGMLLSSFMFSFDGEKKIYDAKIMLNHCWPLLGTCSHLMSWDIWNDIHVHTQYILKIKTEMICVYLNYKGNDCPDIHKC